MKFVDTNVIVRFLLNDVPSQSKRAKKLFENASLGKTYIFTSTIVFFEIYWVFLKFYNLTKKEVVKILRNVMALKFIYIEQRQILEDALDIYEDTSLELEDCYNIVYSGHMEAKMFYTFDKKLNNYLKKS